MAPETDTGKVRGCACSMELFGSFSATSARYPTFKPTGFETPPGATNRNSREPTPASADAVNFTTSRLSSLAMAGSLRDIPPEVDSIETFGAGAARGGTFVALN